MQIKIPCIAFKHSLFFVLGLLLLPLQLYASDTGSEGAIVQASLTNTYWKLTELEGQVVKTAAGQREMKLSLREGNKITGFAGCNSFFGSYTFDESKLTFGQLAASRKFCAETMDMENLFLNALSEVAGYIITGQTLQLLDDAGKSRASLQAVYLK